MRNTADMLNISDELTKIERRSNGQIRIATLFRFWRTRFYLFAILIGFILISQNLIAGTCFIFQWRKS
jgi:hypothetical protein